jgi:ATP-binding cassette, subfamily B, bacterial
MWGGIDRQLYGIDGGRSAIDRYSRKRPHECSADFCIRHRGR